MNRQQHHARAHDGFSLVEMVLVTSIMGILGTVAVPSVMNARRMSAETATVGTLRLLQSAQSTYAASCGSGYYAPTVARLATAPSKSSAAFIGPDFNANVLTRQGYRINFSAGAPSTTAPASCNGLAARRGVVSFFVGASPVAHRGARFFGTNQGGVIYESPRRVRAFHTGAPPAPAVPIQ